MAQYIDKAAIVAEIERLIETNKVFKKTWKWKFKWFYRTIVGRLEVLEGLKIFLNTLEVKEVGEPSNDLEEEIELVKGDYEQVDVAWNNDFDFIARHFYELGLKEQLKNK